MGLDQLLFYASPEGPVVLGCLNVAVPFGSELFRLVGVSANKFTFR
jgi:hypothetical protein